MQAGLAIFNSCDKAGSIPFFTEHLAKNPCDYWAWRRRGRAYIIIGKTLEGKADIGRAVNCSSGAKRLDAEAELQRVGGNINGCITKLDSLVRQYPDYASGWGSYGSLYYCGGNHEKALPYLNMSVKTAKENFQTGEPDFPWHNFYIGGIYEDSKRYDEAKKYYTAAIESAETLTVAHMGLCRVNIEQGNLLQAICCFNTAKRLNGKLVHWGSFDEYRRELERSRAASDLASFMASLENLSLKGSHSTFGGHRSGGSGSRFGGSGGNDGGSSDDDEKTWDKLKAEAPIKAMYRGRTLVQSECGSYWYSRDTAGHGGAQHKDGGAYVKVYIDKRTTLEFAHAADKKMRPMTAKHESREDTVIKKCDLIITCRKR